MNPFKVNDKVVIVEAARAVDQLAHALRDTTSDGVYVLTHVGEAIHDDGAPFTPEPNAVSFLDDVGVEVDVPYFCVSLAEG